MYNGIGLQTARGSGTSGYVQKNLSFVKPYNQTKQRDSFLKELQSLKDNVLAPPKKANKEILLHQQKRDIQLQLLKFREKLEQEGKTPEEIDERVKKAEKILNEKLENGELELASTMDYHKKAAEKEKEYERVRQAFQMPEDYKPGSAFDFESQEKKRLEQLYEKEKKKYEQKKIEKKAEKERLKAEQDQPQAIEGEAVEGRKEGKRPGDQKKMEEETGKLTNKELRARQEANRREYEREREANRRRNRSRSPRDSGRRDRDRERERDTRGKDDTRDKGKDREREDKDKEREKEKEKDRIRQKSASKEKSRLKERSRDRSKEKTKEDTKRKGKEEPKERSKRRDKSSSSERSSRSAERDRRRKRSESSSSSESKSRSRRHDSSSESRSSASSSRS